MVTAVVMAMAVATETVTAANRAFICLIFLFATHTLSAQETEFHFHDGACIDQAGAPGFNSNFLGECGDLSYHPGRQQTRFLFPPDLSHMNLNGARLKLNNLAKKKFNESQLQHADLREANFSDSTMEQIQATGAVFTGAILHSANLKRAMLVKTNFDGARLRRADLEQANLRGASLIAADLTLARFNQADLRGAVLTRAVIVATSFTNARFDKDTRLPFSREEAKRLGMIFESTETP